MKNQEGLAGIDLNNLTEAQRKMCVKLLALNHVEFKQNQDSYVATLRLSANDIKNYVQLNKQTRNMKKQGKNIGSSSSSATITTITTQNRKSKIEKQSVKSKEKLIHKTPIKQQKAAGNINIQVQAQPKPQPGSKKPLFKSVKLTPIPKLQELHPQIEIYIYPKRLTLQVIREQIELTYEMYWQRGKEENEEKLIKIYYQLICENKIGNNKARLDQSLVNSLETINHFQYKELGINIFYLFLSQKYPLQLLSYFMVIRALIQDLIGEKIFYSKNRSFVPYAGNVSSNISTNKPKLKWNPHTQQIHEGLCEDFLKIVLNHPQSDKQRSDIFNSNTFSNKNQRNNIQSVFERLTAKMYYCEIKKGNFIKYYDLIDFMLKLFQTECSDDHQSVTNLQLSYSQNSTLNDIIVQSSRLCPRGQPQTKYQVEMVEIVPETEKQNQYTLVEQPELMNNHSVFFQASLGKAEQICKRMQISEHIKRQILEKVGECVESITGMDKVKWIEAMNIEGSQQQINFIQSIQIQYRKMCSEDQKLTMVNSLAKKMLMGPGFLQLFSRNISF